MRLVYIALGWTAGIVLAANSAARLPLVWLGLMGGALVCLWLAWQGPLRLALIVLVAFTLGGLRFSFTSVSSDIARFNDLGGLTIEGVISAEPQRRADLLQLRVDADTVIRAGQREPTSGAVLVEASATLSAQYGDRIAATGLLLTPGEYDRFSYADYLARTDVFSTMDNAAVEVLSGNHGSPLYTAMLDFKVQSVESIGRYLPEPQAGLLAGILLGDDSMIAPEVRAAFNRVGAAHVVAISGFNMVILSGVVMRLLNRRTWWAAVIGIGIIAAYTVLVGASASVIRAALMSAMLVMAPLLRRKTYVPASLAFVALALSAVNPTVLWDVGFQLSFFATLGMALFAQPFSERFQRGLMLFLPQALVKGASRLFYEPLIVSLAAQSMTLPLLALYFGRLQLVVVVVNLLVIPVQALLMILGMVALVASWVVSPLAQALYWFDLLPLAWTIEVVRWFARLPFAEVEFLVPPTLVACFFTAVIGGAMLRATQPDWARVLAR